MQLKYINLYLDDLDYIFPPQIPMLIKLWILKFLFNSHCSSLKRKSIVLNLVKILLKFFAISETNFRNVIRYLKNVIIGNPQNK